MPYRHTTVCRPPKRRAGWPSERPIRTRRTAGPGLTPCAALTAPHRQKAHLARRKSTEPGAQGPKPPCWPPEIHVCRYRPKHATRSGHRRAHQVQRDQNRRNPDQAQADLVRGEAGKAPEAAARVILVPRPDARQDKRNQRAHQRPQAAPSTGATRRQGPQPRSDTAATRMDHLATTCPRTDRQSQGQRHRLAGLLSSQRSKPNFFEDCKFRRFLLTRSWATGHPATFWRHHRTSGCFP